MPNIWAHTVACPYTGKPVPLAPNWWLARSDTSEKAIMSSVEQGLSRARFRVVEIEDGTGPDAFDPAHGTDATPGRPSGEPIARQPYKVKTHRPHDQPPQGVSG